MKLSADGTKISLIPAALIELGVEDGEAIYGGRTPLCPVVVSMVTLGETK